ncbi:unnamed protein product [Clonostachys solani]|uniref:Thiol-specific monooxygenase n=1 Tax=Clonostachys solani TaxID=160281 RepID=A0A9N9ZN95_9HYPO|nr:unnamed protein product [Clonostachys solani]
MVPRYKRVAVIGAGPSGLAAVKALEDERVFDYIRVFERRECVGGLWAYDAEPDTFQPTSTEAEGVPDIPPNLTPNAPLLADPLPERLGLRGSAYEALDTNAGSRTMAYTHTPLPISNSVSSIRKYGQNNSTRPRRAVLKYLEDLFEPYLHLLELGTGVEKIEKPNSGSGWLLTLRKRNVRHGSDAQPRDYWWQEVFDAVVVASGYFNVAHVPHIEGLEETSKEYPDKFEHSKSWRSQESYIGKKVIVVGSGVSAADLSEDLHDIVQAPLHISMRTEVEFLKNAFRLPNVVTKPPIKRISSEATGTLHFEDGTTLQGFDKVIFATGYKLSYPFLPFEAVTSQNRLKGFYQHVFNMEDPSLVVIGQVRAAISFRVYEYQAIAVSRYFAGRTEELPTSKEQHDWEVKRLQYKGPTELFHEIKPDFHEYYGWLANFAGAPAEGSGGYSSPVFEDDWVQSDIEILIAKDKHWASIRKRHDDLGSSER